VKIIGLQAWVAIWRALQAMFNQPAIRVVYLLCTVLELAILSHLKECGKRPLAFHCFQVPRILRIAVSTEVEIIHNAGTLTCSWVLPDNLAKSVCTWAPKAGKVLSLLWEFPGLIIAVNAGLLGGRGVGPIISECKVPNEHQALLATICR